MVTKFGLSEKIGRVYINNDVDPRDGSPIPLSDSMQQLVDAEIKRLLDESYERVVRKITDNLPKLQNLANALLQYETLSGSELVEIINSQPGPDGVVILKSRSEKPSRELIQIPLAKDKKTKGMVGGSAGVPVAAMTSNTANANNNIHTNTAPSPIQQQKPSTSINNSKTSSTQDVHNISASNGVKVTLTPPPTTPVVTKETTPDSNTNTATSTLDSIREYFFGKSAPSNTETAPVATQQHVPVAVTKPAVQHPAPIVNNNATPVQQKSEAVVKPNTTPIPLNNNTKAVTATNPAPAPVVNQPRVRGPPVILSEDSKANTVENNKTTVVDGKKQ
jgi:hypothetical protein